MNQSKNLLPYIMPLFAIRGKILILLVSWKNPSRTGSRHMISISRNATPTFFLNGVKINTPPDLEGFETLINQALDENS